MKTTALRLDDDVHAQLAMLAQLEGVTVTFAIRQAIEDYVEHKRQNPELMARAKAALADIDRDAATRRDAVASLFESEPAAPAAGSEEATPHPQSSRTRSGRSAKR
ncbi:MAG: DNA-binding protein [Acidimicrobiales bacterium]